MIEQRFDRMATAWDDIYDRADVQALVHQHRLRLALEWIDDLRLPHDARVLEVGCGAGRTSIALAGRGYEVDATDATPEMIKLAQRNVARAGVTNVRVGMRDAHDLEYPDASFDLVVTLGVIPWLHSPDVAMGEMARVLRPGGHLLINADNRMRLTYLLDPFRTPLLVPLKTRLKRLLRDDPLGSSTREPQAIMHRPREFDSLLESAGLTKLRQAIFGFDSFTLRGRRLFRGGGAIRLHVWLQALADRGVVGVRALGNQYLVLAQKTSSSTR